MAVRYSVMCSLGRCVCTFCYKLIFFFSVLFDLYDLDKQKVLTHDGMFRIYRLLFHTAVSDDHILALVYSALRHPNLAREGEVSRDEFIDVSYTRFHKLFNLHCTHLEKNPEINRLMFLDQIRVIIEIKQ